ncbi:hypothetical protein ACN27B_20235 [Micromonospora sp. WMMD754]|uniref:hypothetical protein n=1 Tax=Micromonospora sp. WMMD754 TaxID=3404114 RepID=UPI003BF579A6
MTAPARWETGSSFPLILPAADDDRSGPAEPWHRYGSGRQALLALLTFGRDVLGWRTAHLPTYFCPPVAEAVATVLPVHRYPCGPGGGAAPSGLGRTDAVLAVSFFGERPVVPEGDPAVVVDATHDPLAPWLPDVGADYVVASLRKTLPLPDGGALWSPAGRPLPAEPTLGNVHRAAAGDVLAAMCLKSAYLGGTDVDKQQFLALYAEGEEALTSTAVSAMSSYSAQVLPLLPVARHRRHRIENAHRLADRLTGLPGLTARAHPFGVVLELDSPGRREELRAGLIRRQVYPAVLWSLTEGQAPADQVDFSRRMLFLHTDARYDGEDMRRTAEIVREQSAARPALRPAPLPPPPFAAIPAAAGRPVSIGSGDQP